MVHQAMEWVRSPLLASQLKRDHGDQDRESISARFGHRGAGRTVEENMWNNQQPGKSRGRSDRDALTTFDFGITTPFASPNTSTDSLEIQQVYSNVFNENSEFATSKVENPDWWMCDYCMAFFAFNYTLQLHARQTGHAAYACHYDGCKKAYKRQDSLSRHKKEQHGETGPLELPCDHCNSVFQRTDKRKQHMRKDHSALLDEAVDSGDGSIPKVEILEEKLGEVLGRDHIALKLIEKQRIACEYSVFEKSPPPPALTVEELTVAFAEATLKKIAQPEKHEMEILTSEIGL